jgi:hypothetical protein
MQVKYAVLVNKVPECLQYPLSDINKHLYDTASLYHFLVHSRLLWKVWMVDEYGKVWIAINRMEEDGVQYHTLALDEGTYERIDTEEAYEIVFEEPLPINKMESEQAPLSDH